MALLVVQGLGVGEGSGAAFRDRPKLRDRRGFLRACGVRSSRAGGSVPRHTWSRRHVGNPALPGHGAAESRLLTQSLCNSQRQLFAGGRAGADCVQLADPAQAVSLALTTFCGVPQRLLSALLF